MNLVTEIVALSDFFHVWDLQLQGRTLVEK